ncbi:MAG: DUF1801 domain-containing protein [Pseudomonadota bacterium]
MADAIVDMDAAVAQAYSALPAGASAHAHDLRALVLQTALDEGLPPPMETLKWGEPAYLPGRSGTTVRIGPDAQRQSLKLLVHCQTNLVERWRQRFDDRLSFEGNRAVLVPVDRPLDRNALASCIAEAFTYHRNGHHG